MEENSRGVLARQGRSLFPEKKTEMRPEGLEGVIVKETGKEYPYKVLEVSENLIGSSVQFSSVQSLSRVRLFATP